MLRKYVTIAFVFGLTVGVPVTALHAEDRQSSALVQRAWQALQAGDADQVSGLAAECLKLYGEEAARMQAELQAYPAGEPQDVFRYWALNDVATILFVEAEAYRRAGVIAEAKARYQRIVDEFGYGQAWDPQGFFWKPAQAAREKLQTLDALPQLDYGDYSSSFLTAQAWHAYRSGDDAAAKMYVDKVIELYDAKARDMQRGLTALPAGDADAVNSQYWALNDVGTSYYIRGKIYQRQHKPLAARMAFETVISNFNYAQWWDPSGNGAFFQAAQAAREALNEL